MSLKNFYHLIMSLIGTSLFLVSCTESEVPLGDWQKASDFEGKTRSEAVGFLIGDKEYIATGIDEDKDKLKDIWAYDASDETWDQKADMPDEALARSAAVAFSAGGKGYVGTGLDDDGNELKDFWCYDPDANTWSAVAAEFPGNARFSAVAFSINDHGYVGTGHNDDDGDYKDFYRYTPEDGSWTKVPYPGSKRRDACTFVINNTAYFLTGTNSSQTDDTFYSYNETNDGTTGWTELRHISDYEDDEDFDDDYTTIERASAVAFTINGKGYLATGSSTSSLSNVWEYDPKTDLWEEKTKFEGSSRSQAVGFAYGNYGYILTGAQSSSSYLYDMARFDPNAEYDDKYE